MRLIPKNLEPFRKDLGTARIIGLGEFVHGTDKIHAELGSLALGMIQAFGSETVLIEAPVAAVEEIDHLIRPGQMNTVTVEDLEPLYRIWRTPNMAKLFDSMRVINQTLEFPLQLRGFDIRIPTGSMARLKKAYLSTPGADPMLVNDEPFDLNIEGLRDLEDQTYFEITRDHKQPKRYRAARTRLTLVLQALNSNQDPQVQMAIKDCEDWLNFYSSLIDQGVHAGYLARDAGLFRHVGRLEQFRRTNAPIILIAHFCHLAYQSERLLEVPDLLPPGPVLGTHLRKDMGTGFIHIGVGSAVGKAKLFDSTLVDFDSKVDSIEHQGPHYEKNGLISIQNIPLDKRTVYIGNLEQKAGIIPSYLKVKFKADEQVDYFDIIP